MIIDARLTSAGAEVAADIVIVGAGPAGMSIAARFGESSQRILVLESGGPTPQPDFDLARGTVSRPYYDLPEIRLRGLGGGSACWGGYCERLSPADLRSRYWVPNSGWCLEYAELARYYPEAEHFCGIPVGFSAAERFWRPGRREAPVQGVFDQVRFVAVGHRNLGAAHQAIFEGRNVDLLLHATVTEIVMSGDGSQVDHLIVQAPGGTRFAVTARIVVLATGGVENARLLLTSRTGGWRAGIGNDNGLVGRYFMEHPHLDVLRFRAPRGISLDPTFFDEVPVGASGAAAVGALSLTPQVCESARVGRAKVFIEKAGLHLAGRPTIRRQGRRFRPRYAAPADGELAVIIGSEQAPNRESRITLSDRRDSHGVPLPHIQWDLTEFDHRTIAVVAQCARDVLGELGVRTIRTRLPGDQWPLDTIGGPHHLGTTRIAASEREGVVDADCRVHNVTNLFVAGGSVLPTVGCAPPTLTIVALALRLADHLKAASAAWQRAETATATARQVM